MAEIELVARWLEASTPPNITDSVNRTPMIRDPSGNRVEFMWSDVETLPDTIATHVDHVEAEAPTEEPAGATIAPNVTVYEE